MCIIYYFPFSYFIWICFHEVFENFNVREKQLKNKTRAIVSMFEDVCWIQIIIDKIYKFMQMKIHTIN